jgi:hypothetical protein
LDQISSTDDGETVIVFDDQPVPVPHPFDEILQEHLADRPNMNMAANRASAWLFPGYRPGQHLHPGHLMKKLRNSGFNLLGARNATLRALVLTTPPPVAAQALGYSTQIPNSTPSKLAHLGHLRLLPAIAERIPRAGQWPRPNTGAGRIVL